MKIKNLKYIILKLAHHESKGNLLFPNQANGLKHLFNGESIIDTSDTGSGKTLLALASLLITVSKGKVGVYLAPTSALRDSIYHRIKEQIDNLFPNSRINVLSLDKYLTVHNLQRFPTIIIATYEKFIAEYIRIRMRKGFHRKKWIGSVVVDEAHNLGDDKRGTMLELLLRMIKIEQEPQFVFLSATFPNTEKWEEIFDLRKITKNKFQRNIKHKIRIINPLDKYATLKKDIEEEFAEKRGHIGIVFCASRGQTESLRKTFEHYNDSFKYVSIHAGYTFEKNKEILAQIEEWQKEEKNVIVLSTTIIMAGLDLKKVSLIVFYDADAPFFTGSMLKQGAGRSREKECSIYFYFANPYNIQKKLVVDEEGNFEGYVLNEVTSYKDRMKGRKKEAVRMSLVKYAVMLYLANTSKTKRQIIHFLKVMNLYDELNEGDNRHVLNELVKDRMLFINRGWVKLTAFGIQTLLTAVKPDIAKLVVSEEFLRKTLPHKLWDLIRLQGREVKTRFGSYVMFLEELVKSNADFKTVAEKYFSTGDLERVRKDLAWLSSAIKVLVSDLTPEEHRALDVVLKKTRSYKAVRRGKIQTFKAKRNHVDLAGEVLSALNKKSPLTLSELAHGLKSDKGLVARVINKQLLPKNLVKKVVVKEGNIKGVKVLVFKDSDKIPEHYFRTCKDCMFFVELPHHNLTQKYCLLHQQTVSKKHTACENFQEKPKEHYRVIDNFPEKCVVCGFPMNEYAAMCPSCGTVYIPKKNSKYRVIVQNFHKLKELLENNAKNLHFDPPPAVRHHFSLAVRHDDVLELRGDYIYVRRDGQKKGELWAPQLLKHVIIKGDVEISEKLRETLNEYNVPVYYFSGYSADRDDKGVELRNKLETLTYDAFIIRDYTAKVTAELLSDIILMRKIGEVTKTTPDPYIENIINLITSMLFRYLDLRPVDALAFEGGGKAVTWNYLKNALGNLIPPRVTSRFVPYYYTAAKSPFHAVYNYMIRKLVKKTRVFLKSAGFLYYEAGPGMLHQRNTKYVKKNEGLLFDVIDMFRAPFLLASTLLLIRKKEVVKYFEKFKSSTAGYVYAVDRISSFLLDDVFVETINEKLTITPTGTKTILTVLRGLPIGLLKWLSDHEKWAFPLFMYVPTEEDLRFLVNLTRPLDITFYSVKPWVRISNSLSLMGELFRKK